MTETKPIRAPANDPTARFAEPHVREFVAGARDQIKRASQIVARLVAFVRILRKAPRNDAIEGRRKGCIVLRRRNGVRRKNLRADFSERISRKRPDARNHLVQHDTQRK